MAETSPTSASRRPRKRAYLLITLFAVLLVVFPFLFWYFTWFGRRLSDAEIGPYLADRSKPRHAQHALVQIGERMRRHQAKNRARNRGTESNIAPARGGAAYQSAMNVRWLAAVAARHAAIVCATADRKPRAGSGGALARTVRRWPARRAAGSRAGIGRYESVGFRLTGTGTEAYCSQQHHCTVVWKGMRTWRP